MADYFFRSSIPTSYCMTQNYISHHIVQRLSGSSGPPRVRGGGGGGYPRAPQTFKGPHEAFIFTFMGCMFTLFFFIFRILGIVWTQ